MALYCTLAIHKITIQHTSRVYIRKVAEQIDSHAQNRMLKISDRLCILLCLPTPGTDKNELSLRCTVEPEGACRLLFNVSYRNQQDRSYKLTRSADLQQLPAG